MSPVMGGPTGKTEAKKDGHDHSKRCAAFWRHGVAVAEYTLFSQI